MPSLVERILGFFGLELIDDSEEVKNVVIHRQELERALNSGIPIDEMYRLICALQAIGNLRKPIFFDSWNLSEIVNYFQQGNRVVLHGAYKEQCLKRIYDALAFKGVQVNFSSEGCV